MIDKYEEIYARFKPYIESNSQYNAEVVKYNTNAPSRFPLVSFVLDDTKNTDNCTNDKIEFYDSHYFIINIYTKDKNWPGNLNLLLTNLNVDVDNRGFEVLPLEDEVDEEQENKTFATRRM